MEEAQFCPSIHECDTKHVVEICINESEKEDCLFKLLKQWGWTRKVLVLVETPSIAEYLYEKVIQQFGIQVKKCCYVVHGCQEQEDRESIIS